MGVPRPVQVDTTSNIVVLGSGSRNLGGRITFGDNSLDLIGNSKYPSVMLGFSCSTSPLDELDEGSVQWTLPYNLGSSFTCGGAYGGPAFFGATRGTSAGDEVGVELCTRWNDDYSAGHGFIYARLSGNPDDNLAFNMVGEPEFKVWNGEPATQTIDVNNSNNIISLTGVDSLKGCVIGYSDGDSSMTYHQTSDSPILLPSGTASDTVNNDLLLTVMKSGCLPYFCLVADHTVLENRTRDYMLRDIKFGNLNLGYNCDFTVGLGGRLNVRCLDSIESDNGLTVLSGGEVNLKANNLTLGNDKVQNEGSLTLQGKTVVLGKGFCVEQGGLLDIATEY